MWGCLSVGQCVVGICVMIYFEKKSLARLWMACEHRRWYLDSILRSARQRARSTQTPNSFPSRSVYEVLPLSRPICCPAIHMYHIISHDMRYTSTTLSFQSHPVNQYTNQPPLQPKLYPLVGENRISMQRSRQSKQHSIILHTGLGIPRRASPENRVGNTRQRLVERILQCGRVIGPLVVEDT